MIEPIDLYRAAWLLIKRHGEDAPLMAAMRADDLLAAGDMEGCATFKRIVEVIGEIARQKRPDEAAH